MTHFVILAMFFSVCTGCVTTRSAQPEAIKQPDDATLTCEQIALEYKTNTEVALNKISKNRSDDTQDVVVGFLV